MSVIVVGAGGWGMNVVRTFHELGVLVAVVEPDESKLASIQAVIGDIPVFDNLEQALPRGDAVAIATPVPTHFEIAAAALDAGKDVFVEKPMTETVPQARNLAERAAANDSILMAGHMLLYQPAIGWMRKQIESGALGEIYSIHQERLNHGRARAAENVLWSLGVHDIAMALYLLDLNVVDVEATGSDILQEGIEDDVHATISFEGGVTGHLHVSWLWPEKRRRTTIVGSKGMYVYDELSQTVTLHKKSIDDSLANVEGGTEVAFEGDGNPLTLELQHFIDCVENRTVPRSGPGHAVETIQILDLATRAMRGEK